MKNLIFEATHMWYCVSLVFSTLKLSPSRSTATDFPICWGNYLPTCLPLQSTQNITQSRSGLSLISGHIVMTSLSASKPRQARSLRHLFKCLPWWGACRGLQLLCGKLQTRSSYCWVRLSGAAKPWLCVTKCCVQGDIKKEGDKWNSQITSPVGILFPSSFMALFIWKFYLAM